MPPKLAANDIKKAIIVTPETWEALKAQARQDSRAACREAGLILGRALGTCDTQIDCPGFRAPAPQEAPKPARDPQPIPNLPDPTDELLADLPPREAEESEIAYAQRLLQSALGD